jgi:hypothetical protein
MKKLFLTSVAALLLATGTAYAHEFVVILQKDNEKASVAFATMGMSCAEALESHERNRKAGTWLMYVPREVESPGGSFGLVASAPFQKFTAPRTW